METYCMWGTAWEYMLLSFQDYRYQFHPPQFLQNLPAMDNELDTHDTSQSIWNMRAFDPLHNDKAEGVW